jgi:hypothetical protein
MSEKVWLISNHSYSMLLQASSPFNRGNFFKKRKVVNRKFFFYIQPD